jgi:aryl-alcohol dehydrogenase-like predicted oxidoreductase
LAISKLGLGTWSYGGRAYGPLEDSIATAIISRAYELGIRFFDTAHIYGAGRSEELLGETLHGKSDAVICTKVGYDTSSGKGIKRYDTEFLDQSLDLSLKRLQREKIDLLLLHNPPADVLQKAGIFEWLRKKVRSEKILRWGLSVYDSVEEATIALAAGGSAIEARYSLIRRDIFDQLPCEPSVAHIARSPFDSGLLTGKQFSAGIFPKTDLRSGMDANIFDTYSEISNALMVLIKDGHADSLAELAVRFSAFAPNVTRVIPGAKSVEQLELNVAAVLKGPLSTDALQAIDEIRAKYISRVV